VVGGSGIPGLPGGGIPGMDSGIPGLPGGIPGLPGGSTGNAPATGSGGFGFGDFFGMGGFFPV
jgi:hypothetical protein